MDRLNDRTQLDLTWVEEVQPKTSTVRTPKSTTLSPTSTSTSNSPGITSRLATSQLPMCSKVCGGISMSLITLLLGATGYLSYMAVSASSANSTTTFMTTTSSGYTNLF